MKDLTDQPYGRLIARERAGRDPIKGDLSWWCECRCGSRVKIRSINLRMGRTRSCGCLRSNRMRDRNIDKAFAASGISFA